VFGCNINVMAAAYGGDFFSWRLYAWEGGSNGILGKEAFVCLVGCSKCRHV